MSLFELPYSPARVSVPALPLFEMSCSPVPLLARRALPRRAYACVVQSLYYVLVLARAVLLHGEVGGVVVLATL